MDFIAYISAYASFFELTVAFNFAYAASQSFRDIVKGGFLSDVRNLKSTIDSEAQDLSAMIGVLQQDGDIDETHGKAVSAKMSKHNEDVNRYSNEISNLIENAQEKVSDQLKAFYIVIGIYGLFVLFLSGQEQIHKMFPLKELLSETIFTALILVFLMFLTFFTSVVIPIIYLSIIMLVSILFSISPYSQSIVDIFSYMFICNNKYLIDIVIIFSIMPSVFAYFRYVFNALKILIPYKFKLWKIQISILMIKNSIKQFQSSKKYLNNLLK